MIGQTISHYRIVTQLGAGGMGVVYGADDVRLGRPVALKFIPEEMASDRQAIERFRIEARATSALNHPNICTVYDVGEHDGHPFIVMEWMRGQTLHDRITRGPLKVSHIVEMGIEIADALDAAHSQNIMHRDVKPANIFLTERGHVKLMDFGLAKLSNKGDEPPTTGDLAATLTMPGMTLGTASYMSPEQAAGDTLDSRSDLFSVGVVLYECATGHRPFTGTSARAILGAILNKAPLAPVAFNPELPARLQDVINTCLEKDPDLRYQTAADLGADLKRLKRDIDSGRTAHLSRTPGSGVEPALADQETPQRVPAPRRADARTRTGIAVAMAIAMALLAAGYWQWGRRPAPAPTNSSVQPAAVPAPAADPRIALAESSLRNRQFRTAHAYAEDVLASRPKDAAAVRIRDESAAMLKRADASIQRARQLVAAGDVRGAVRALDEARTIDANASGITDVTALLAERFKAQADAAESELRRSRATAPLRVEKLPLPASPKPASPPVQQPVVPTASPGAPPSTAAPQPAPAAQPSAPLPEPPPRAAPEASAAKPAPVALPANEPKPSPPPAIDDDAAIRGVVAAYARAIESKDLALFRMLKPNIGEDEARRIERGFRAVTTQKIDITILSIERRGDRAVVQLRRQDVIEAGGRRHTPTSRQTMTLAKTNGAWVIVEIGG